MAKRTSNKASETAAQPASEQVRTRCRACGSTDMVALRKIGEQDYAGLDADGQPYTSIVRRRVQCRHCQQLQVVMERLYDPAKWRGKLPVKASE